MATGTVKWFSAQKGFGFIVGEDGKDIFVHHTKVLGEHKKGLQNLKEGQSVVYDTAQEEKGLQAVNVEVVEDFNSLQTVVPYAVEYGGDHSDQ